MKNIDDYRRRAIKAILQKLESLKNEVQEWDYKLDELARNLYDLPPRPTDDQPYVGWMSTSKSNNKPTEISQTGINLIKRWEGFRDKAYLCPGNVWTIGYGHTKTVYQGMCINKEQAEQLLKEDLRHFEASVSQLVTVKLNQVQFDALVSFTFNVGVYAFKKSTLLRFVNQGSFKDAANEFDRWVYANRKKLPGLVKRREDEKQLFLS